MVGQLPALLDRGADVAAKDRWARRPERGAQRILILATLCGGTVAGAVGRLIEAIEPGSEAIAVISPAISGQQYPVGNDVIEAIQAIPGGEKEGQDGHLDLRNVLVEQLIRGGFTTDRMAVDRRCNASDPDLFSHRGEGGTTGRGGLLIGWNL